MVTNTPDYTSANYAANVEAELTQMQDANRLALHRWEDIGAFEYPATLQGVLAGDATSRNTELGKVAGIKTLSQVPLLSMTLLTAADEGRERRSVLSYEAESGNLQSPAYLFSLEQDGAASARVVAASPTNMSSGTDMRMKRGVFTSPDEALHPLTQHYRDVFDAMPEVAPPDDDENPLQQYAAAMHKSCAAAAADPAYTEKQLDLMGAFLQKVEPTAENEIYFHSKHARILSTNEILVSATQQHCKAICIPVYPKGNNDAHDTLASYEAKMAFYQLQGALTGLQHLAHGIDLPVVFYQINGRDRGAIHFMAQGKQPLIDKAVEAIGTLQQLGIADISPMHSYQIAHTRKAVHEAMNGLDLFKPVEEQADKLAGILPEAPLYNTSTVQHRGKIQTVAIPEMRGSLPPPR